MTHDLDIRWLAGFTDGEGSFTLITHRVSNHLAIKPAFQVANTNLENMRAVKAIVSDIVGREVRYDLSKKPSRVTHRPYYYLNLTRQSEIVIFCETIRPYVIGKREQVELMLRYLASTPKAMGTRGGRWKASGYTPEHFAMVAHMSDLNRKYAPGEWRSQQETERVAPPLAVEETVRPLA